MKFKTYRPHDVGTMSLRERRETNGNLSTAFLKSVQSLKSSPPAPGLCLKPTELQATILKGHFPSLDISHVHELSRAWEKRGLSICADGLIVRPKDSALARFTSSNKTWPAYNRALCAVLAAMKHVYGFVDYIELDLQEGTASPLYERLSKKTALFYGAGEDVPGDVLVFPAQMGRYHQGISTREARGASRTEEFGLDSVATGCVILTHLDQIQAPDIVWINCAGSERSYQPNDHRVLVPCWYFLDGGVRRHIHEVGYVESRYGSASGFSTTGLPVG